MASEYEDIPLKLPTGGSEMDDPEGKDEEGEMTDDKLGLALKRAIAGSNGAAICEMVRKITDSY